jgi:hypothetical protein
VGRQRTGDESGRAVGTAACPGGVCVWLIESLAVAGVAEGVNPTIGQYGGGGNRFVRFVAVYRISDARKGR